MGDGDGFLYSNPFRLVRPEAFSIHARDLNCCLNESTRVMDVSNMFRRDLFWDRVCSIYYMVDRNWEWSTVQRSLTLEIWNGWSRTENSTA